jgi:O-antigen ligase
VSGKGQLHGGLYGYPVAVVMSSAALLSGVCRSRTAQLALAAVMVTNFVCVLLTYERTFWFTTIVAVAFVIAKLSPGRRVRALAASLAVAVALLGALALAAPRDFTAMRDRALSSGQGWADTSYRWRAVETELLLSTKIDPHPLLGWGLGDFLHWGQPWLKIPSTSTWFAHNGYLWMVWKTGVLVALLLFALLTWAVVSRGTAEGGPFMRAFRTGSQGGLVVLLLSSVTFPSFNSLSITAVMGALLAVCFAPQVSARRRASAASG